MAVYNLPNYLAKDGFGMSLNIRRGNPNPLDNSSVWASLAAAQAYAQTDPVAYVGQVLTVVSDVVVDGATVKTATAYVIDNEAGDLKEVGSSPVGDENTITVSEDGTVSLVGIDGLALTREEEDGTVTNINYQPLLVNGKLTWVEPSATTVEGLATEIEGLKTRISTLENVVGNEESGLVKSVADNAKAISDEVTAREDAVKEVADAVDAVEAVIGDVAEGKTVVEMIADAQEAATYDDTELAGKVSNNETAIQNNAKAISDEVTAREAAVKEVADAVDAVEAVIGDVAEGKTVVEMIADAEAKIPTNVSAFNNDAKYQTDTQVEETVRAAIAEINHAVFEKVDSVPAVADAVANVLYLVPNGDKMDIYAKIGEEMVLIDDTDADLSGYALKSELHEHANKALLDSYTQSNEDLTDAVAKKHDHSFTDASVEEVIAKKHEHANKALLDSYTQSNEDIADAVAKKHDHSFTDASVEEAIAKKHEHSNASVLENISAEKVAAWDAAEKNVIASVDEAQFAVDADRKLTLLDVPMDKITGLADALDAKANKGTTLAEYGIADAFTKTETVNKITEMITDINGGESAGEVLSQLNAYKELTDERVDTIEGKLAGIADGAQVNVLESVKINGAEQAITDKSVNIPVASGALLGVVTSSSDENKVSVASDGTMEVNRINVDKIVQDEGTMLILDGGGASI